MSVGPDKAGWRARLLAAREQLTPGELAAAADAVRRHVLARLADLTRIAAYVPIVGEPGSVDLLDALRDGGTHVLLPVVRDGVLHWASYAGRARLVPGTFGVPEPDGVCLGPAVLGTAEAVLVPALAVDRRGIRLGRGGGYYDRTLATVAVRRVVALLHDGELLPELPADPWDRPVAAAITPGDGWTELPVVPHHGD